VSNKSVLALASPVTQGREAVKQLIAYQTHGHEPQEMPEFYRLGAEMVLVQSNRKDAYFVTTPRSCSCPAATHSQDPCVHQRKFFPQAALLSQPVEAVV